jgi:hypothetical protein
VGDCGFSDRPKVCIAIDSPSKPTAVCLQITSIQASIDLQIGEEFALGVGWQVRSISVRFQHCPYSFLEFPVISSSDRSVSRDSRRSRSDPLGSLARVHQTYGSQPGKAISLQKKTRKPCRPRPRQVAIARLPRSLDQRASIAHVWSAVSFGLRSESLDWPSTSGPAHRAPLDRFTLPGSSASACSPYDGDRLSPGAHLAIEDPPPTP